MGEAVLAAYQETKSAYACAMTSPNATRSIVTDIAGRRVSFRHGLGSRHIGHIVGPNGSGSLPVTLKPWRA
jgi:hypothetical protein